MTRKNSRPPKTKRTHRKHRPTRESTSQKRGRTRKERVKTHIPDLAVMVTTGVTAKAHVFNGNFAMHACFQAIVLDESRDHFPVTIENRAAALRAIKELRSGAKVVLRDLAMSRDTNEEGMSYLAARDFEILQHTSFPPRFEDDRSWKPSS